MDWWMRLGVRMGLADIAPTILKLLGLKKHDSMQGDYLI
jgi:bisphosphoglycerate-independent phosphoglycerate mutase (AlkP superfamily)